MALGNTEEEMRRVAGLRLADFPTDEERELWRTMVAEIAPGRSTDFYEGAAAAAAFACGMIHSGWPAPKIGFALRAIGSEACRQWVEQRSGEIDMSWLPEDLGGLADAT